MEVFQILGSGEIYGISLFHGKLNYDSYLEVVLSVQEAGQLRVCERSNNSILQIDLDLAYGKLDDLKNNNRYNLRNIDSSDNRELFKYEFKDIDKIKDEVKKYSNIRIWVDNKDINCYLFKLFFAYYFFDEIKNSELSIVNIDNYYHSSQRLAEIFDDIKEERIFLTNIEEYKLQWEKQLKINSEVRDLVNDEIVNLSYSDLYNPVLEFIKPKGRKNRASIIGELMMSNILNNGNPIIYNYIINCLVNDGKINVYMRNDIDKDDQFYSDEIRNNEIEYKNMGNE